MVRWKPFNYQGQGYDLTHLHHETTSYFQPAKGSNPPRGYRVDMIYSLHCFTREIGGDPTDPELCYSDSRETRHFDFKRHALSFHRPSIIKGLMGRTCFQAKNDNYLTIALVDKDGNQIDYEIYFSVSRSSKPGVVNLYVQSAYSRDEHHRANKINAAKLTEIPFAIILFKASK